MNYLEAKKKFTALAYFSDLAVVDRETKCDCSFSSVNPNVNVIPLVNKKGDDYQIMLADVTAYLPDGDVVTVGCSVGSTLDTMLTESKIEVGTKYGLVIVPALKSGIKEDDAVDSDWYNRITFRVKPLNELPAKVSRKRTKK